MDKKLNVSYAKFQSPFFRAILLTGSVFSADLPSIQYQNSEEQLSTHPKLKADTENPTIQRRVILISYSSSPVPNNFSSK